MILALLWVPLVFLVFSLLPKRSLCKRRMRNLTATKALLASLAAVALYILCPEVAWFGPEGLDVATPTIQLSPAVSDNDGEDDDAVASRSSSASEDALAEAKQRSSSRTSHDGNQQAAHVPSTAAEVAQRPPKCSPQAVVTPAQFGAVGDGRANDTQAVADALAFLEHCGGTLLFGPGPQRFAVWPGGLRASLKNVVLHFDGALMGPSLQSWNPEHGSWPAGSCAYGDTSPECHSTSGQRESPEFARSRWSLLHLVNSSNVTIRGDGASGGLMAPGRTFWTVRNTRPEVRGYCLIKIEGCSKVRMSHTLFRNSPMYHVVIMRSSNVKLTKVRVQVDDMRLADNGPHNTDAISIIASSDVSVTESSFESGDDNIVIKESTQDVFVSDVILSRGKGISIGSLGERAANRQVVNNIFFSNVTLHQSFYGARIKTWRGGSGIVRNVTFENFVLDRVIVGFIVDQDYCPLSQRPEGCADLNEEQAIRLEDVNFRAFTGSYTSQERSIACRHCWQVNFQDIDLRWVTNDRAPPTLPRGARREAPPAPPRAAPPSPQLPRRRSAGSSAASSASSATAAATADADAKSGRGESASAGPGASPGPSRHGRSHPGQGPGQTRPLPRHKAKPR
mmetsp:Transcript_40556/g.87035  ORF Transcript_40556/g.87035 Transcript_40556/m.87035 type:complete len:622 (+) Transcript_40556:348-2213(+)